jgi:hypothetical protein
MNNLFSNQIPFAPAQNNMKLARIGEPLSVNGLDSVKTIPTMPNTITIAFHEKDPIFYKIATDANNHPMIEIYHYTKDEDASKDEQYVTLKDFQKLKEELLDEWKYIWNEPAATTTGTTADATIAPNAEHTQSKSKPSANASDASKSESSIW